MREKRQWDRALDKVARGMLDAVLGNIGETDHEVPEEWQEGPNRDGVLTGAVREAVSQLEDEQRAQAARHERALTIQAMKMVQKKMLRSVTQRCVTEIIQESTDAIYKFEDDAISLADWVLRSLLQKEIRAEIFEAVQAKAGPKRSVELIDEHDFCVQFENVVQPQEALMSDRGDTSEIPQERNYHPGKYQVNLFDSQNSSKFEELGSPPKQS